MGIFTSTLLPIRYLAQRLVVPGQQGYPWLVRQELLEQQAPKGWQACLARQVQLELKVFKD